MRINKYDLELNEDRLPVLVKESDFNYAKESLTSPDSVLEMVNSIFRLNSKAEEHVYILATDTKCKHINVFEISKGTVNASFCNSREIFIRLLLCGAVNMIMIHNHPSGDITASKEDFAVYKRIKEAATLIGINFMDNIIIGENTFLSFKEDGE